MTRLYIEGTAGGATAEEHIQANHAKALDARHALSVVRRFKRGGNLLELGPGGGHCLTEAARQGFTPHAIELHPKQARYLQEELGVDTFCGSAADPDAYPDSFFDVVFHRNLVSHLHEPVRTLANLRRMLKPNGIMVFETGNGGDLSDRWLSFLVRLSYPEHVVLFGARSMKTLLDRCGFELAACRRYSNVPWVTLLRLTGRLRRATNEVSNGDATAKTEAPSPQDDVSRDTSGPDLRARIRGALVHSLRYRVSRGWPRNWPATMLCVARLQESAGN
jgi:SAM-dependent methyltransferase